MAEPTEGCYVLVAAHSLKAMDVQGATDGDKVNVRQYTRNDSDAQMWALVKIGSYWQIYCSLTGKCLDIANNTIADGTNIRQYSDNNSPAQRWNINTDGKTISYQNVTYNTYLISSSTNSNYVIDVNGISTADGANIMLHSANGGNNQRWILVPKPTLSEVGAYKIIPASDSSMVIGISNGAETNNANAVTVKDSESAAQTFKLSSNNETLLTQLINAKSGKVLTTLSTDAGHVKSNIVQKEASGVAADLKNWLIVQQGTMTVDGSVVPTYQIRQAHGGGVPYGMIVPTGKSQLTNDALQVDGSVRPKGEAYERFAFVKTDIPASNISAPGELTPKSFVRSGLGSVTVTGLIMQTKETAFQARYKVRSYSDSAKTAYTDSAWMNLKDDSTARSGWGEAWTATFTATPSGGIVALPFTKSFNITASVPFIDIYFQVRVFKQNYSGNYSGYGTAKQTKVEIIQNPTLTYNSFGFSQNQNGDPALKLSLTSSFATCQSVRARLYNPDGSPFSDWKSSSSFDIYFDLAKDVQGIPDNGTVLTANYEMITDSGTLVSGSHEVTVSYTNGSAISMVYQNDSASVLASCSSSESARCYTLVDYSDGARYVECEKVSYSNGVNTWKVLPTLNKDADILVISQPTSSSAAVSKAVCHLDSHLFIWNWNNPASDEPYDISAALFVNVDAPPAQTRTYSTDIQFQSLVGRTYPVAFASRAINAALSVEGVAVDDDAKYTAAGPMPSNVKVSDLKKLISLSGEGIHPLYRSPYGDWAFVGIESVDLSKSEIGFSNVKVTQRVVED